MTNPNVDPHIMVSWTDDGGHTWTGYREVSIGREGEYDKEVRVNRLGHSSIHGRSYRIEFSAACKFALVDAMADVTMLRA